jgi:hypothetical protein
MQFQFLSLVFHLLSFHTPLFQLRSSHIIKGEENQTTYVRGMSGLENQNEPQRIKHSLKGVFPLIPCELVGLETLP